MGLRVFTRQIFIYLTDEQLSTVLVGRLQFYYGSVPNASHVRGRK